MNNPELIRIEINAKEFEANLQSIRKLLPVLKGEK